MPSSLNADNGVVSGTAGLKSSADSSGVLDLQTNGTTAISISASQVVSFANQPTYTGGTANGVMFLNGSKAVTTGTALVFDGTNLGIGTSSPNTRFHVVGLNQTNGTAEFTPNASKGGNASYVHYGTNGDWYIRSASASGNVNIQDTGGNVGIGTSSPFGKLHVSLTDGQTAYFSSAIAALGTTAISLGYATTSGTNAMAKIIGQRINDGSGRSDLALAVRSVDDNTSATIADAKLFVSGTNGNVGIGTSSPSTKLHVAGSATNGAPFVTFAATATNDTFNWATTTFASNLAASNNLIHFIGQAGSSKNAAYFGFKYSSSGSNNNLLTMGLYDADNLLNINGLGNVSLSGATTTADGVGITFRATQSASSNANTLDDYEEGTWTPTFVLGSFTYNQQVASYTKVGRLVTVCFIISWTAKSGSGTISVAGLPFTAISTVGYRSTASVGYTSGLTFSPATQLAWAMSENYTTMDLATIQSGSATTFANVSNMSSSGEFQGTITYFAVN